MRNGGGFVGIHSAADSFRGSRAYVDMLNGEFLTHPEHHEFKVTIADKSHYLTARMPDFSVFDEMYHLQNFDPAKCTVLAQTQWQGKQMPMAYARDYGQGRVAYVAPGHTLQAWRHPEFQKLLIRAIAWSTGAGAARPDDPLRPARLRPGLQHGQRPRRLDQRHARPARRSPCATPARPASKRPSRSCRT